MHGTDFDRTDFDRTSSFGSRPVNGDRPRWQQVMGFGSVCDGYVEVDDVVDFVDCHLGCVVPTSGTAFSTGSFGSWPVNGDRPQWRRVFGLGQFVTVVWKLTALSILSIVIWSARYRLLAQPSARAAEGAGRPMGTDPGGSRASGFGSVGVGCGEVDDVVDFAVCH